MANSNTFVLKLANYCECEGCTKTLKKLQGIDGVHSTSMDAKTGKLTIWGPVNPQKVLSFLEKKGKKASLVSEGIGQGGSNRNVQIITMPASLPQWPVVQEFNDQNLVAQVQELAYTVKGLKELEVTCSKKVKVKFNGKNKDHEVSTSNNTRIKMVKDENLNRGYGTGTSFCGPHLESMSPWQGNYFPPSDLQLVGSYEPSAPPSSKQVWVMRKV